MLGVEKTDPSPSGVTVSVLPAAGGHEGDWYFGNMLVGPSTGLEEHRVVLGSIQSSVRGASFLASDNGLDVVRPVD